MKLNGTGKKTMFKYKLTLKQFITFKNGSTLNDVLKNGMDEFCQDLLNVIKEWTTFVSYKKNNKLLVIHVNTPKFLEKFYLTKIIPGQECSKV